MARFGKHDRNPGIRPVIRAELSEKNKTIRWILIIVFLCIALVSFVVGLRAVLDTEPGWEQVDSAATEMNYSSDFIFNYCFGQTQENPSTEKKRLTLLYSEIAQDAYRIFTQQMQQVNLAVDVPVTVDPALYDALALVQQYGNRCLYLAPVYVEYNRIFLSTTENEAVDFDPGQNPELAAYVNKLAAYANDPAMIDMELLDDYQVRLVLSEEYETYAAENEITEFVSFDWMTNAFVADYMAERLSEAGFTNGFLASFDGFTRNLDNRGEAFSLNLFDRQGTDIYLAGAMEYNQPIAIVFLRDFPMSQRDRFHYYGFSDGRVVTAFIDPYDGLSKSAVHSLTAYSYRMGCAEILMQQAPVFLSDSLDVSALETMADADIYSLWFDRGVLYCNDPNMTVKLNPESGANYTLKVTR